MLPAYALTTLLTTTSSLILLTKNSTPCYTGRSLIYLVFIESLDCVETCMEQPIYIYASILYDLCTNYEYT